jgi:hypothetical protein
MGRATGLGRAVVGTAGGPTDLSEAAGLTDDHRWDFAEAEYII